MWVRLWRSARSALKCRIRFANRVRRLQIENALETKADLVRVSGSSLARSRFDNVFAEFVPSQLWRRITSRLFHGSTFPLFSLTGLALSANGLLSEDDEQDILCWNVKSALSKFSYDLYYYEDDMMKQIKLNDLDIGNIIAKGCCGVVYSAKLKDEAEAIAPKVDVKVPSVEVEQPIEYPLALKIMFNYNVQSDSIAILNAMYHETLPAIYHRYNDEILYWQQSVNGQNVVLPPHPNIVLMYSAFADYMPNLRDSMDNYPQALPMAHNTDGLGRNMTLFLLMKRYKQSLNNYLQDNEIGRYNSLILFAQLLEAVVHINRHGVAHRDLKSDNILIEEIVNDGEKSTPLLAISDFGLCLADKNHGLRLPYSSVYISKGGNINLMAPEIMLQQPGIFSFLDYRKSDLWTAGTIAYEIFGHKNPFSCTNDEHLSNMHYVDEQLPSMSGVPYIIERLVKNILSKNPKKRLQPDIAANVCQLYLWAPSSWLMSDKLPKNEEILQWIMRLAIKLICEGQLANTVPNVKNINAEYYLIASFLLRLKFQHVKKALYWIQTNN